MNSKILVGIVIILVGLAAGWFALGGMKNISLPTGNFIPESKVTPTTPPAITNESNNQPVATTTVNYTDSGFSPAIITVKKGTMVTFVNQSSSAMWVASNPHPTHSLLPGFDELTSVVRGGKYQYTFNKVGTWKYHNHPNAGDMGTVVVTE